MLIKNFNHALIIYLISALFCISCDRVKAVDSFPASSAGGLEYDGTHFWLGGGDFIWEFDAAGHIIKFYTAPGYGVKGIAYAGNFFYAVSRKTIFLLDMNMDIIDSFDIDIPVIPVDLAFDGTNIWLLDFFAENIYKLDTEGNVLEILDSPCTNPSGLAFDGTHLWVAGTPPNLPVTRLYKITTDGRLVQIMDGPGLYPQGLVFVEGFLWLNAVDPKTKDPAIYKCKW